MPPEMVVTQQSRRQDEAEATITSKGFKMTVANSNEGVSSTSVDGNSEEERCEAETTVINTTVENNDANEPSLINAGIDGVDVSNEQDPAVTTIIAPTDQAGDDALENEAEQIIISDGNQNDAPHVELENANNDEADENSQSFVQYQQSISSDSLVQVEEKDKSILLQQPLLNDDDEDGVSSSATTTKDPTPLDDKNKKDEVVQKQHHVNIVDANEGSEHGQIDEKKIDDGSLLLEKEQTTSRDVEIQSSSSSQSNSNNDHDTSNNPTGQLLFPDRATMSMSPSLLRNNNNFREEGFTPSPTVMAQLQPQQYQSPPNNYNHQGNHSTNHNTIMSSPSRITYASPPGRRTIKLRLLEEIPSSLPPPKPKSLTSSSSSTLKAPFKRIRSLTLSGGLSFPYLNEDKSTSRTTPSHTENGNFQHHHHTSMLTMDRGIITVSWYDGTTSSEMQEHVFGCVLRKLNKSSGGTVKLEDVRLLDENVEPHEEVVLCPFLPDGSQFLLRFRIVEGISERTIGRNTTAAAMFGNRHHTRHPFASRAPDSPSAEPSPHPSNANLVSLGGNVLHPQQLQVLNAAAAALMRPPPMNLNSAAAVASVSSSQTTKKQVVPQSQVTPKEDNGANSDGAVPAAASAINGTDPLPTTEARTDDLIEQQLRQLNELFLQRRSGAPGSQFAKSTPDRNDLAEEEQYQRDEKKQVIFLIGNYLVLFMSLIALSAEIQSRLPQMMKWVQENYDSVQNCATDRDALVDCLSKGDFSGLVASFLLWATQSVVAKRIFLFGFDTPKKLWTVVYEALVTAVCWGISYLFIRRGLNPNTRQNFVHKYWKDAVYGSLAGFNAAFLKAVLKNLVPQDVALEALEGRQLKIFHWLGALLADE